MLGNLFGKKKPLSLKEMLEELDKLEQSINEKDLEIENKENDLNGLKGRDKEKLEVKINKLKKENEQRREQYGEQNQRLKISLQENKKKKIELATLINDFEKKIENLQKTEENQKTKKLLQEQLEQNKKNLKENDGELSNYNKKLNEINSKKEKEQNKIIEKAQKASVSYDEKKEKLFGIIDSVLADNVQLASILHKLNPNDEAEKDGKGISFKEKLSAAASGIKFVWNHKGEILDLATSGYLADAEVLQRIFTGKEEYDHSNPPFFIKLLKDKATAHFLTSEKTNNNLRKSIDQIVINLIPVIMKELGKEDAINEFTPERALKLQEKQKQLEELKKSNLTDENKITKLQKQIDMLNAKKNAASIATVIKLFKEKGINSKYINEKLTPVITSIVKYLLTEPKDLLDVASKAIEIFLTTDSAKKKELITGIINKIDLPVLLANHKSQLAEFLQNEGGKLANATAGVIESNEGNPIKDIAKKFGIEASLVRNTLPVVSKLSATLLEDSLNIERIFEKIKSVLTAESYEEKIKKATSLEELKKVDDKDTEQFLEITKAIIPLVFREVEDNGKITWPILDVLHKDLAPELIKNNKSIRSDTKIANNQETLAKIVPGILKGIVEGKLKSLEALVNESKLTPVTEVRKILISPLFSMLNKGNNIIGKILPPVAELVGQILKNTEPKEIKEIYQNIEKLITSSDQKQKEECLNILKNKIITIIANPDISKAITTDLSVFLRNENNGILLSGIVENIIKSLPAIEVNLNKLGVKQKDIQEMAIGLTPIATKIIGNALTQTPKLTEAYIEFETLTSISKKLLDPRLKDTEKDMLFKERNKYISNLIDKAIDIIQTPEGAEILDIVQTDMQNFLSYNQEKLVGIAKNIAERNEQFETLFKEYGVSADMVADLANIGIKLAAVVLKETKQQDQDGKEWLQKILVTYNEMRGFDGEDKNKKLIELSKLGLDLINREEIKKIVKDDLQKFIDTNLNKIKPLQPILEGAGNDASKLVEGLLPMINKLAQGALKNSDELLGIMNKVNNIISTENALDRNKKISGLINDVIKFTGNAQIKTVIENDLKKYILENNEAIGKIIQNVARNTKIGKNLNIEGERVGRIIADHASDFREIAELYAKGSTFKMITKAVGLLANKDIRAVTGQAIKDIISFKYERSIIPAFVRRVRVEKEVNEGVKEALASNIVEIKNKEHNIVQEEDDKVISSQDKDKRELKDLGEILEKVALKRENDLKAQNTFPSRKDTIFIYSLKNRDLRGLNIGTPSGEGSGGIRFNNVKIHGFKFKEVSFKNSSFENSLITNTSFENAEFKTHTSFKGATIDAKTLETLLPSIRKFNFSHESTPITLNNVKIIGDISRLKLDGISMQGADLTEAQTSFTEDKNKRKEHHTSFNAANLRGAKFNNDKQKMHLDGAELDGIEKNPSFLAEEKKVLTTIINMAKKRDKKNESLQAIQVDDTLLDTINQKLLDQKNDSLRGMINRLKKDPSKFAKELAESAKNADNISAEFVRIITTFPSKSKSK
jgi:uncharacterized protein YjbI with pentapeptide repeats